MACHLQIPHKSILRLSYCESALFLSLIVSNSWGCRVPGSLQCRHTGDRPPGNPVQTCAGNTACTWSNWGIWSTQRAWSFLQFRKIPWLQEVWEEGCRREGARLNRPLSGEAVVLEGSGKPGPSWRERSRFEWYRRAGWMPQDLGSDSARQLHKCTVVWFPGMRSTELGTDLGCWSAQQWSTSSARVRVILGLPCHRKFFFVPTHYAFTCLSFPCRYYCFCSPFAWCHEVLFLWTHPRLPKPLFPWATSSCSSSFLVTGLLSPVTSCDWRRSPLGLMRVPVDTSWWVWGGGASRET